MSRSRSVSSAQFYGKDCVLLYRSVLFDTALVPEFKDILVLCGSIRFPCEIRSFDLWLSPRAM